MKQSILYINKVAQYNYLIHVRNNIIITALVSITKGVATGKTIIFIGTSSQLQLLIFKNFNCSTINKFHDLDINLL